jgi:hypothetical protein
MNCWTILPGVGVGHYLAGRQNSPCSYHRRLFVDTETGDQLAGPVFPRGSLSGSRHGVSS